MENQTFERIVKILNQQLADRLDGRQLSMEDELSSLGVNSLAFIKIVVALETEFDIEFDDEDLDASQFTTLGDLVNYLKGKLGDE